jgi:hypothetical protein
MPRDRAQQLWGDLRFAVVGDIVSPFVHIVTHTFDPTFSSPTKLDTKRHTLVILPKQMIVFNDKTRAILHSEPTVLCKEEGWGGGEFRIGKCSSTGPPPLGGPG